MERKKSRKGYNDYSKKRKRTRLRSLLKINDDNSDSNSDNDDRLHQQLDIQEIEIENHRNVVEQQELIHDFINDNDNDNANIEPEELINNINNDNNANIEPGGLINNINNDNNANIEPGGLINNINIDDNNANIGIENEENHIIDNSEDDQEAENTDEEQEASDRDEYAEQNSEDEATDDSEEDEENIRNCNYEQLLYPGAPVTVNQSMCLILSLLVRHNVTQTCLSDIINVINLHCIDNDNNSFKNSLYKFRKFFSLSKKGTIKKTKHFYCLKCQKNLTTENDNCDDCDTSKKGYFIEIPVKDQLKELYKRPGFYNCLQHRFDAQIENNNSNIMDVYQGSLYKKFVDNGFLANRENISLTWYTDGIPVFKSSKISMWPVYLSINELPFAERSKRENLLLIGLWFGSQKPNANNYFYKFYGQFKKLTDGINVTLTNNEIIKIRAVLLIGTCDLPAKCQFFNFTYFMGAYGCPSCLWPGETFRLTEDGSSHTHVYPYIRNPEMRTSEDCIHFAEIALNNDSPHMGVKGPCALSKLMPDFVVGTAIDQMHCVFGGVCKKLLSLYFDTSYRNEQYSLVDASDVINNRLIAIKPPSFVHRMPRSTEDLIHWKASELKNWFYYYALPVMNGIMQPEYFEHLSLLIAGISLLNSDSIGDADLDIASNLLHKFVREFEILYGLKHCSINLHLIIHLTDCVRALGPLWANECFRYEDLNGQYLNVIHGTRHIDSQVVRSHNQQLKLQKFFDELPEGKVKDFCSKQKHNNKICERLYDSCYVIGTYKIFDDNYIIPNSVQQAIEHLLPARQIIEYQRLLRNSKLYVSERYSRAQQTSSSYILFKDHTGYHLGSILCFVKLVYCQCINDQNCLNHRPPVHQAIVQPLFSEKVFNAKGDQNLHYDISYLHKSFKMNNFMSIPIEQLIAVCFEVKVENDLYVAIPVNSQCSE